MIKNYFKTAFRNLLRNKVYSFINIAGLSLGLACIVFFAAVLSIFISCSGLFGLLLIALVTVSFQATSAALRNPAKSLKTE